MSEGETKRPLHFIEEIIEADNAAGTWGSWPDGRPRVHTRFPPEPNGYLHIGHAKAICLNHGLATKYGGKFNLRFDDTNPEKEESEYVEAIRRDVKWLGADYEGAAGGGLFFASNYFQQMYDYAVELVKKGKAFVCDLSAEQTREYRGTLTRPGRNSPFRHRGVDENLDLLDRMRRGEFPDGTRTLRAKIDMTSPNMNLRDPVMYRIVRAPHHNTGDQWCIYPMYDWAHGLEDSIEGITHSICTLEFENHRPLYNWFIESINERRTEDGSGTWGRRIHHPRQIEFARLSLTHVMTSKRKLLHLVREKVVSGWDDPRMPTLAGMRRRGYTPEAIRDLCERVGVAKFNGVNEIQLLEACVREHLNRTAPRVMAVLRPLKLVITNWPAGTDVEWVDAVNNPEDESAGTRRVPFSRELFIEREDFMEVPAPKYWRLYPGNEVRLRYGFFVKCTGCVKDAATGEVSEVHCTYDPATRGGDAPDGRKVKSTLHWVSAAHALPAEVRLYNLLFTTADPEDTGAGGTGPDGSADWLRNVNPASMEVVEARVEPSVANAAAEARYQFERHGYFCVDRDSGSGRLVFNRTVTLKDSWGKQAGK